MTAVFAELLKRLFTNKNGGFIKLRHEDGTWDGKAWISLGVRLAFIGAAAGLMYWVGLL